MKTDEQRMNLVSTWSIHPDAADRHDVAWLAAELMETRHLLDQIRQAAGLFLDGQKQNEFPAEQA